MERYVNLKELRPRLSKVMEEVDRRYARYVVTRRGRPEAVILSSDEYAGLLETLDILQDKAGLKRLLKAMREVKAGRTRSLDKVRRALRRA